MRVQEKQGHDVCQEKYKRKKQNKMKIFSKKRNSPKNQDYKNNDGCLPEREGVIAKSNWGSSKPAAMGMATTLYATAHDKF